MFYDLYELIHKKMNIVFQWVISKGGFPIVFPIYDDWQIVNSNDMFKIVMIFRLVNLSWTGFCELTNSK